MKKEILLSAIILILINEIVARFDNSYFLPKNVKPLRYTLTMEPELNITINNPIFTGKVLIELQALETTKNITLHVRNMDISEDSIKIVNQEGHEVKFVNTFNDLQREFYVIHLANELLKNQHYNLSIDEFRGDLRSDNVGFYLAKYTTEDGEERHLAVTDFEPSDARKAFPCFDEPATKARFIIKLIRPQNYFSISNQELLFTTHLGNGRYQDTFRETVPMSTYVVAFVISDFIGTPQIERHRIYARPQAIGGGKLDYALSHSVEILQVLEKFTGINFTLNKMDLIAIPDKYFSDEAMENWGLITFSEKHLFITNDTSTTEDEQRCVTYIAHEFGHQWFGNLVTFKSWKYLWLSEGFGAYLQYKISSIVKPSWRLMDQFVLQTVYKILEYDISYDAQPLNYEPKGIGSIPSPWICYFKASSVLRMVEHFLSEDIFKMGLHYYLEKNKFRTTEPSNLYIAFQEAVDEHNYARRLGNLTVSSIMQTWDSNPGFPLVTASRNYATGTITLSQKRYFDDVVVKNNTEIWYIPISLAFQSDTKLNFNDTTADAWLTRKEQIIYHNYGRDGWYLINKQQTGFYRVNYDLVNWHRLALYLNSAEYDKIHPLNRAQLLFDSFHFAQLGQLSYTVPLDLSKYLIREIDYIPLSPFLNSIAFINAMMQSSEVYHLFKNFVISSLSAAYDHLGFDENPEDSHLDKQNRIGVLKWICRLGHLESRYKALQKIRNWKNTGKQNFSQNLYNEVLCCAMRNATPEDWQFIYNQYELTTDKRIDYFEALACSEDVNILNNFLNIIMRNKTLSTIEGRVAVIKMINNGNIGLNTVLDYVKNYPELPKLTQGSLAYHMGLRFTTEEQYSQMKYLNDSRNGYYRYGLKLVQENMAWINKGYLKEIEKWLEAYGYQFDVERSNII